MILHITQPKLHHKRASIYCQSVINSRKSPEVYQQEVQEPHRSPDQKLIRKALVSIHNIQTT